MDGSGSNQYGDSSINPSNILGETQAIYKQFTNLLLEENDARDGFKIESVSIVDKYVFGDSYSTFLGATNVSGWK